MEYGLAILRGTRPSALSVTRTKLGIGLVNRETAQRLQIPLTGDATRDVTLVSAE